MMKVINVHFFNQPQLADDIKEVAACDTLTIQRQCYESNNIDDRSNVLAEAMMHLAEKYGVSEMLENPAACAVTVHKFETSKDGLTTNVFVCFPVFYGTISADINAAQLIADLEAGENVYIQYLTILILTQADILEDKKCAAKTAAKKLKSQKSKNRPKDKKGKKQMGNPESNCDKSDSMKENFSQSAVVAPLLAVNLIGQICFEIYCRYFNYDHVQVMTCRRRKQIISQLQQQNLR